MAPLSCLQSLDSRAVEPCRQGHGDACADAVRPIANDITFADTMSAVLPKLHDARMECIESFASRGCSLGSARSCAILGAARRLANDDAGARRAWTTACDRGDAERCWSAAIVGRSEPDLALAERGCDLGSSSACNGLGDFVLFGGAMPGDPFERIDRIRDRHSDINRGFGYWERGCIAAADAPNGYAHSRCTELREMLMVDDCPRRNEDDALPLITGETTKPPPAGSPAPPEPAPNGGICDIDPSACPRQKPPRRPHVLPPELAPLLRDRTAARARIMEGHRLACSRGSARDCLRPVEIEIMRFNTSLSAEQRNQADPPAFDVAQAARDQCARGIADACLLSSHGDVPTLLRACDLGSPLACARAGHHFRVAGGAEAARAAQLLARACAGGIRWTCELH